MPEGKAAGRERLAQKKVGCLTLEEKRAMIEQEDNVAVSVRQQCELLDLNRSSLYYKRVEMDEEDLRLMNALDEEFTKRPCLGVRQMTWKLKDRGCYRWP